MSCDEFDELVTNLNCERKTETFKLIKSIRPSRIPQQVISGRNPDGTPFLVNPVSLYIQEVYCRNCYETIAMTDVDRHSHFCTADDLELHSYSDSDVENEEEIQNFNEKIFKFIQTFLKKLDDVGLQLYNPEQFYARNTEVVLGERGLIHEIVQQANKAMASSDLNVLQDAAEQLDHIEDYNDLNIKMAYNTHLLFNRLVQIVY